MNKTRSLDLIFSEKPDLNVQIDLKWSEIGVFEYEKYENDQKPLFEKTLFYTFEGKIGLGRKINFDKEMEEGQFNENLQLHGFGRKFYPTGHYYIGSWKNGLKSGFGTKYYHDGEQIEGEWEDDIFIG